MQSSVSELYSTGTNLETEISFTHTGRKNPKAQILLVNQQVLRIYPGEQFNILECTSMYFKVHTVKDC